MNALARNLPENMGSNLLAWGDFICFQEVNLLVERV
jgi:hypothetical protein